MRFKILICSLMMLGVAAPAALAGSMDLMATIVDRWSPDFSVQGLPVVFDGGRVANGQAGNYEIELSFTAVAAQGDKGWLNTLFSCMDMGPGLDLVTGTWSATNPNVDVNGAPPPGATTPVYGTNQDAGVDSNDLQNVIISLASAALPSNANDRRNATGTAGGHPEIGFPAKLGRFFVSWDGVGEADLLIKDHAFSFSLLTDQPGPEQAGSGDSIGFGAGIIDDFVVDDLFLGGRLPGQIVSGGPLPTNDDDDPDSVAWSLLSLIGPDGAELGAVVDPLTGVFTWDSAPGDSRGAYTATIQGINTGPNAGDDTGLLTFNLVPEPASITLLGLAMVGAIGFIRRR